LHQWANKGLKKGPYRERFGRGKKIYSNHVSGGKIMRLDTQHWELPGSPPQDIEKDMEEAEQFVEAMFGKIVEDQ
jgi:hypothetical protein